MRNYGTSIFCADFETFVENSKYCLRYNNKATTVYAIAIQRVPVHWTSKTDWVSNKYQHGHCTQQLFGTIDAMMDYLNNPKQHGTIISVYFHNGQKFDFYFLIAWFEQHYKLVVNYGGLKMEEVCYDLQGINFYMTQKSDGWLTLKAYVWNEEYSEHVWIEFRDSMKVMPGSIAKWSTDLLQGVFYPQFLADRWAWTTNNKYKYDLIDINKKPLDINYVQDLKDGVCYCSDGTSYQLNEPKQWPPMIRERVGNDVLIMVYVIKYMLINHLMNTPKSSTVCQSTGSYSVKSFVNELLQDWNFKKQVVDKDGAVDNEKLWDTVYGCSQKDRDDIAFTLHDATRGGICTLNPHYANRILTGSFISLDVNSEYPFIATSGLPYGKMTELDYIPNDGYYFVHFSFKKMAQLVKNATPVLMKKWEKNYNPKLDEHDYHYSYSLNDGEAWAGTPEWKVFTNKNYFQIDDLKIIKVYAFKTVPWLANYMLTNNKVKINNKGIARLAAKTKSNSFTGKLSQRSFRGVSVDVKKLVEQGVPLDLIQSHYNDDINRPKLSRIPRSLVTGEVIVFDEYTPTAFGWLPGYCAITSGGRAWLMDHMFQLCLAFPEIRCLYNDTDSIKFKVKNYKEVLDWLCIHGWLNDKELGKFKEEFNQEINCMKIIAPKKYLSGKNGIIDIKRSALSGLKWDYVFNSLHKKELTLDDIQADSTFTILKPFKVTGGVLLKTTAINLNKIHSRM